MEELVECEEKEPVEVQGFGRFLSHLWNIDFEFMKEKKKKKKNERAQHVTSWTWNTLASWLIMPKNFRGR